MKTRIISAVIGIILLSAVLYLHSTVIFNIVFAAISALMIYELFRAFEISGSKFIMPLSACMAVSLAIIPHFVDIGIVIRIYILVMLAYAAVCVAILLFRYKVLDIGRFCAASAYALLIAFAMSSLCIIEAASVSSRSDFRLENIVLVFCGAWLSDTGAYFVGTFFGKHKLCPDISPKKTIEGFIGGLVTNALLFMIIGYIVTCYRGDAVPDYLLLAVLGFVCSLLGILGDLLASFAKRRCGIKDFGNIMPGHGGALDRFDSVVFVAPFMAAVLTWTSVF